MKKKSIQRLTAIVVSLGLLFLGVGVGIAAEPKEVKIGVVVPLTGPVASIGIACQRGLILAVDHINQDGGIKSLGGAKIKLFFGDDEAKPDVAMAEAERLIKNEKVDALVGAYTSSCSFPVTQVAEANRIPIIVPASAKDEITERGFKYTFRLVGKASKIGSEQINFIKWLSKTTNVPITTVGLLFEDSAWGQSLAKNIRELVPNAGYKIVSDLSYPANTKDVRSTVLRLKSAKPDVVIQESYTMDAILITKTMHELQFDCKGIVGTGTGHSSPDYHAGTGGLDEYMMQWEGWSTSIPLKEVQERAKGFQERFKLPMDPFAALFYSSGYALVNAMNNAGSVDKDKVREAMSKLNIKVGEKGNLFLYPSTFDENGQAPAEGVYTQRLKGKMDVLYPESGATTKPVFPIPLWGKRK